MSINRPIFADVVEADITQLSAEGARERLILEFKRDMYGVSDADRKEFLKDVSSFANSAGGHLVIGLNEVEGIAGALAPIAGNADEAPATADPTRHWHEQALNL